MIAGCDTCSLPHTTALKNPSSGGSVGETSTVTRVRPRLTFASKLTSAARWEQTGSELLAALQRKAQRKLPLPVQVPTLAAAVS